MDDEVGDPHVCVPADCLRERLCGFEAGIELRPGQHQPADRRRIPARSPACVLEALDLIAHRNGAAARTVAGRHPRLRMGRGQPHPSGTGGGHRERDPWLLHAPRIGAGSLGRVPAPVVRRLRLPQQHIQQLHEFGEAL